MCAAALPLSAPKGGGSRRSPTRTAARTPFFRREAHNRAGKTLGIPHQAVRNAAPVLAGPDARSSRDSGLRKPEMRVSAKT